MNDKDWIKQCAEDAAELRAAYAAGRHAGLTEAAEIVGDLANCDAILAHRDALPPAPESDTRRLKQLLHHVLHQRTGPLGLKVEDDLLRENEPLLLECLNYTRDL